MVTLDLVHAADLIQLMNTERHSIVTFIVLALFLLEITLRQISGRMSFWGNRWNIFDVVVIYVSWILAIIQHVMERKSAKEGAVGGNTVAIALALCHDSTYSAHVGACKRGKQKFVSWRAVGSVFQHEAS
jgi:hypothetical protein